MDTIADAVNPVLALLALVFPWLDREAIRRCGSRWSFWTRTLLSLAVVYAVMFADERFDLWSGLGLDYSTHTAFAVAITTSMSAMNRRWLLVLVPVLVAYAALMIYLGYHSSLDTLAAALVIAPATWLIHQIGADRERV
ncbi:MAG: hypothetical protein ACRDQ2_20160 [Gaiellales bacterium]